MRRKRAHDRGHAIRPLDRALHGCDVDPLAEAERARCLERCLEAVGNPSIDIGVRLEQQSVALASPLVRLVDEL